jgi:hypothetical protein
MQPIHMMCNKNTGVCVCVRLSYSVPHKVATSLGTAHTIQQLIPLMSGQRIYGRTLRQMELCTTFYQSQTTHARTHTHISICKGT